MNLKQQNYIGTFLVILVVASISRLYGLDRLSLWADELWVVVASLSGSLTDMISAVYYHDNHPPGHYLLVRYTQVLLGSSDFAIRFPSALAGIALVAATYAAGKKAFSVSAAIVAAALVTGSYQAIYYSQEARPNIFVALFALLSFHYFQLVLLRGDRSGKNYYLFWLSAVLCSYFHYAGLVFCACLGLVFLAVVAVKQKKDDFVSGLKLFLPVIVLYIPWLVGTLRHLVATPVTAWQRPPDFNTLKTTFNFLFGPDEIRIIFYLIMFSATIVIVALSVLAWLLNKKNIPIASEKSALIAVMLAMIVSPVVVFYIKSVVSQDAYNHRHFLYAIPLLSLLAGYYVDQIIGRISAQKKTKVFITAVVFILLYQIAANNGRALYTANHFKQEFREATQVAADNIISSDKNNIMIVSNTVFFDHYLRRFFDPARQSDFVYDWDQKLPALQSLLAERHIAEFYYLEAPIIPGANNMITAEDLALMKNYRVVCRTRFKRAQVFKFSVNNKNPDTKTTDFPDCRTNAL